MFKQYLPEIPSRLAKYHNTGEISVVMNGESIDIDKLELQFKSDSGETVETAKISDSKFKFKNGIYGFNTFSLTIPSDTVNEIVVEFGQFNTNWWHVCDYDVDVVFFENNKEITAQLNTQLTIDGITTSFVDTKTITATDNVISNLK